jgi:multidrug efflux system membrane fusion protein
MKTFRRLLAVAIVGVLVVGVTVFIMQQPAQKQQQRTGGRFARTGDGPVPVLVAPAQAADVPVYLDGVGTAKALNTVTVRAQVDGILLSVNFKEGQDVKRGDVLAVIDPVTFQAQLDQQVAKKTLDEAQLANARLDLARYVKLALSNAGNKQQADTQRALVAQLEAQVKIDQAMIDNARAMLGYTKITAPLAGRTGIRQVDQGNIVHASDATGIVTITQIRPIAILFTLPQQQLSQVNKAQAKGVLPVEAMGADNKTVADRGTLQVVDNQVDPTTGTVKLKAEFPNPELQIWPGQFINVRLLIDTLRQVVVVPTAAVQRGPTGTFVYVVKEGDVVGVRPVTVSLQDDTRTVITSGLQVTERVVTTGFARLADGTKITISTGDTAAPPPPANRPPGERRKKRGETTVQGEDVPAGAPKAGGAPSATP